jgi:hypothetical protein
MQSTCGSASLTKSQRPVPQRLSSAVPTALKHMTEEQQDLRKRGFYILSIKSCKNKVLNQVFA